MPNLMNQTTLSLLKKGQCSVTVDGKNIPFAEIIEMEAKVELKTTDVMPLGQRMTSKK